MSLLKSSSPELPSAGRSVEPGYALYDLLGGLLVTLALPLLPLLALTRFGAGWRQRLGRIPPEAANLDRPLWIHAASVGEVLSAEPLLRELRRLRPGLPVLVTTTTVTGRAAARERLGADAAMLLPIDFGPIIGRTLTRIRPRGLVIVENELWPGLLRAAARRGIPIAMASGRISPRTAARLQRWKILTEPMLGGVSTFLLQSVADGERLRSLGAPADRIEVLGSLKFAREAATVQPRAAVDVVHRLGARPLLVAASTHPGEEEMALEAMARVWGSQPEALLLLAPRRPSRFTEVAGELRRREIPFLRRSALTEPLDAGVRVLLLDSVGELPDFLPIARAVFVGGTVTPGIGGHNVLEPAVFGKPAAFGPHTANVATVAAELLAAGAAHVVRNGIELGVEWQRLLADAEAALRMGEAGRRVVAAQAGVAGQMAMRVLRVIEARGSDGPRERAT